MEIKVKIIYGYDITEEKQLQQALCDDKGYHQVYSSHIPANYFGVDIDYFIYDFLPIKLNDITLKASPSIKEHFNSLFEQLTANKRNSLIEKYGPPQELFIIIN